MAPGTMQQIARSGKFAALSWFATETAQAYADGRLRLTADCWARGWTEVFPELTEEERRLAELPGFTAEQQKAFILADPALNDGLPAHTGHAPEGDPVGNVMANPVTEEEYSQILARARNEPGVASGAGQQVGADWLREGIRTGAMPIPASVAERLEGRRFGSFDACRRAFWKAVAEKPELMEQFNSFAQDAIRKGLSPRAPDEGQAGKRRRWEMDHIEPLWRDGGLYDSENLQIMTPKSHIAKTREDMKDFRQ